MDKKNLILLNREYTLKIIQIHPYLQLSSASTRAKKFKIMIKYEKWWGKFTLLFFVPRYKKTSESVISIHTDNNHKILILKEII